MNRTLVLDVVGLTPSLLAHAPNLKALAARGGMRPLTTVTPAVTTTVQSTFVTGARPREHGIVGNGWYFRDLAEIWLWRQSNHLVGGEKLWDAAKRRDPSFTCAKLFWWYNMYASVDFSVTPRPMYTADGRKLPDVYTHPAELRDELQRELGQFPLFQFWGPTADIDSTRWIGRSALRVFERQLPTLTLVYLPHLDYNLQRLGPGSPSIARDVAAVDEVCGELIAAAERAGAAIVVLSEYGITEVSCPIHVNRALRQAGWLRVREEQGREQLDPGASDAFAVADHQIAHVYVARPELEGEVAQMLQSLPGVERVLNEEGKRAVGLDHPRSGELIAISDARQLVYVLPLSRRRSRTGLCAHSRHSSQAGLRPGRALRGPGTTGAETEDRGPFGPEEAWHALSHGRNITRRNACAGLPRPPDRPGREWPIIHNLHARSAEPWAGCGWRCQVAAARTHLSRCETDCGQDGMTPVELLGQWLAARLPESAATWLANGIDRCRTGTRRS